MTGADAAARPAPAVTAIDRARWRDSFSFPGNDGRELRRRMLR